jgi:hypothetical protein
MAVEHSESPSDHHGDGSAYGRYEQVYLVLAASFVVTLVLTNVVGIKLFRSPIDPQFALTTGILTYPFTFVFTDLVSEIYGKKRADFMVVLGFAMSLLMLLITQLAVAVPPHEVWATSGFYVDGWTAGPGAATGTAVEGYQYAFDSVFSLNGTLLVGSMLAYACAQFTDNYLYHFWKRVTKGKHLWLRNNGSTWISQLIDTAVVNSILFYIGFGMDFWTGAGIMFTIYWHKLILAALDTPLVYLGVWLVHRLLGDEVHRSQAAGGT